MKLKWPREPWQVASAFGLLGFFVTAACYADAALHDYTKPMSLLGVWKGIIEVILCPPQLLILITMCIDCEVTGWSGFLMYAFFGVLNAALYAAIGSGIFNARRSRPV